MTNILYRATSGRICLLVLAFLIFVVVITPFIIEPSLMKCHIWYGLEHAGHLPFGQDELDISKAIPMGEPTTFQKIFYLWYCLINWRPVSIAIITICLFIALARLVRECKEMKGEE